MFEGIHTALITPMKNGTVDLDALKRLVELQIEAGVQGIVVCATTGEGVVLTVEEKKSVIETTRKIADDRLIISVGTGRMSTPRTIEQTRVAADLGAKAALVVSPAYIKPSQEGIAAHYEHIADNGGLPIIVYNVPSRTSSDILPATIERLAAHENIVAVKEATGSIYRAQQVIQAARGRIAVLSGDDPVTLSLLVAGGQGVICTASNVVPKLWVSLYNNWKEGNIKAAAAVQAKLINLHEALFLESNPGPVKGAMHLLGLIEPEIRLPLTWPTPKTLFRLTKELEDLDLRPRGVAR